MTETSSAPATIHARGVLFETGPRQIVMALPGTEYRLHLKVSQQPQTEVGKRIIGTIRAKARRIDIVRSGGRYVEPVYGRPRRIQGEILVVDPYKRAVTVDAGFPIECELDERQQPSQFKVGDFVSFDVAAGSSFVPLPTPTQD